MLRCFDSLSCTTCSSILRSSFSCFNCIMTYTCHHCAPLIWTGPLILFQLFDKLTATTSTELCKVRHVTGGLCIHIFQGMQMIFHQSQTPQHCAWLPQMHLPSADSQLLHSPSPLGFEGVALMTNLGQASRGRGSWTPAHCFILSFTLENGNFVAKLYECAPCRHRPCSLLLSMAPMRHCAPPFFKDAATTALTNLRPTAAGLKIHTF